MNKPTLAILVSTVAMNACATASGREAITEMRPVPFFSSVVLNGVGTVHVRKGPQEVRLTIDGNLADRFETTVKNGRLMIGFNCDLRNLWALRGLKKCEVEIAVPDLDGIEVNGAGTIAVDAFDYGKLDLRVTGAATVDLKGTASELSVNCTGGCKVLARGLAADAGRVSLTGSSRVEARVKDSLEASITGAGRLLYWGDPRVSRRISGAGEMRRAGD